MAFILGGSSALEAGPSRIAELSVESHDFWISDPPVTAEAVVARLDSDGHGDEQVVIVFYETPSGGSEVERGRGGSGDDGSGRAWVELTHPVSMYSSGSSVRAVYLAYDDEGELAWSTQRTTTIP